MHRWTWLGLAGGVALAPSSAHAADVTAPGTLAGAAVVTMLAVAAAVLALRSRQTRVIAALAAEKRRMAESLAEREAVLAAVPLALYRLARRGRQPPDRRAAGRRAGRRPPRRSPRRPRSALPGGARAGARAAPPGGRRILAAGPTRR